MAIPVRIYQSNRKGETNGKYYARAYYREMFDLPKLAQHMADHNTTSRAARYLLYLPTWWDVSRNCALRARR